MDGASIYSAAEIHPDDKTIALTRAKEKLKFERPAQDQLTLDGIMGGRKIHMHLQLMDRDKFQLISRCFHWVQEYPFNR